jgi:hypothetical protein
MVQNSNIVVNISTLIEHPTGLISPIFSHHEATFLVKEKSGHTKAEFDMRKRSTWVA